MPKLWLSYSQHDKTYKTESFNDDDSNILLNLRLRQPEIFPLKVFLCTDNAIIGVSTINLIQNHDKHRPSRYTIFIGEIPNTELADNEFNHIPIIKLIDCNIHNLTINIDISFENEICANNDVSTVPLKKEQEESEENGQVLRHYRLSIDMRSIGGLKQPAHVALQYNYPFLGCSMPKRTRPAWMMAHTENRVDQGAASYECTLSRDNFIKTLTEHQLQIVALSRSQLGNNLLGELLVDLSSVIYIEPHSYRCPLTGKVFRHLREYEKHRSLLLTLQAAGKVDEVPPKEPIVIRAIDAYYVFNAPRPESHLSGASTNTGTGNSKKASPNYIVPIAQGGKLRVVVILEDIGSVSTESGIRVKPGYKMHNGAIYNNNEGVDADDEEGIHDRNDHDDDDDDVIHADPLMRKNLTASERAALEQLKLEWEAWRRTSEAQWREALTEKEALMRQKLQAEAAAQLVERAEDLKRAQLEVGRLEVRLRTNIEEVDRQKQQLSLKEEHMAMRLAQRTAELQLLQKRVRDEAKGLVDAEHRKTESLSLQVKSLQDTLHILEHRAKEAETDFEKYRYMQRSSPETVLREEAARLRAQLGECRGEVERERRLKSEMELEKEHYRSQMHRLALALKRERERSSVTARQELEQLRLEFLAREERYVLDGDRVELQNIRKDLSSLINHTCNNSTTSSKSLNTNVSSHSSSSSVDNLDGFAESKTESPQHKKSYHNNNNDDDNNNDVHSRNNNTINSKHRRSSASTKINNLKQQISELAASGLYDADSELMLELSKQLKIAEREEEGTYIY